MDGKINFPFFKKRIIRELRDHGSKSNKLFWSSNDKDCDDLAEELFVIQFDWLQQLGLINTSRIDFDIKEEAANEMVQTLHGQS